MFGRQTKEASTQSDGLITEQDSPPNKEADGLLLPLTLFKEKFVLINKCTLYLTPELDNETLSVFNKSV